MKYIEELGLAIARPVLAVLGILVVSYWLFTDYGIPAIKGKLK